MDNNKNEKKQKNFYIISIRNNLSIFALFYWRIFYTSFAYLTICSQGILFRSKRKKRKTHVDYLSRPQVILKRCSGVWERCHWTRWFPYPWKDWNSRPPLDPAWTELWLIQGIPRIKTSPCKWTRSIRWTTFYCGRTS